jgi:predicted porin
MLTKYFYCSLVLGLANVCNANSLQLYGLIDQGIHLKFQKNKTSDDTIKLKQGNKMGSRFGLKGREEISPKHFVFFNLEADAHHNSPSILFNRRNYIGYDNPHLGRLTLGLQSSVGLDIANLFDPSELIRQKYVNDDLVGTYNGRYGNHRIDRALKYTYQKDNLQLITSYQLSGTATQVKPNIAMGLCYKKGDTLVAGSYSKIENTKLTHQHDNSQILNAGLSHQIGKVNLKFGFSQSDISPNTYQLLHHVPPIQKLQNYGIGFKYQAKPHIDYFVAAYRQKVRLITTEDLISNKFVIGANYHLSKNTHIYGFVNHANGSDSDKFINKITSATVGVVHRF